MPIVPRQALQSCISLAMMAGAMLATAGTSAHAQRAEREPIVRVLEPTGNQPSAKSLRSESAKALHVVAHSRVRVTRLKNGSILCCRDVPQAHLVCLRSNDNDDTASDGDERSDDDDSQDDQSADQDRDSEIVAWLDVVIPYPILAECAPVTSWIIPSFSPFVTFNPLRC